MKYIRPIIVLLFSLGSLSGCTSTELASSIYKKGHYKVGNPYSVDGRVYYPAEVASYSEEGEASWYGPGFHGRQTANGEEFNANDMTAAHRTLPMPSVVRVTNMENGRTVILRVNDRGPFKRDRIIDVSKAAAKALDFHGNGTTHVKVDFMPVESQLVAQAAQQGQYLSLADATAYANSGRVINASQTTVTAAPAGTIEVTNLDGSALPQTSPYEPVAYHTPGAADEAAKAGVLRDPGTGTTVIQTTTVTKTGAATYVQAGAYSTKQKAQEVSGKLSSLGSTTITETNRGGMKLWRVRVMANDKNAAQRIQNKMEGMGFTGAKIVNN